LSPAADDAAGDVGGMARANTAWNSFRDDEDGEGEAAGGIAAGARKDRWREKMWVGRRNSDDVAEDICGAGEARAGFKAIVLALGGASNVSGTCGCGGVPPKYCQRFAAASCIAFVCFRGTARPCAQHTQPKQGAPDTIRQLSDQPNDLSRDPTTIHLNHQTLQEP